MLSPPSQTASALGDGLRRCKKLSLLRPAQGQTRHETGTQSLRSVGSDHELQQIAGLPVRTHYAVLTVTLRAIATSGRDCNACSPRELVWKRSLEGKSKRCHILNRPDYFLPRALSGLAHRR
jgi:hypothetical protein